MDAPGEFPASSRRVLRTTQLDDGMSTEQGPAPSDELAARLEALARRRAVSRPGAASARSLPPPAPGTGVTRQPGAAPPPPPLATTRARRRHPARSARVGALVMSLATTGGLVVLLAGVDPAHVGAGALADQPAPITSAGTSAAATSPSTTPATVPAATAPAARTPAATRPTTTTTPATTGVAATSGFDGAVVQTRYGPVQVQAQVAGGVLVDVAVEAYPNDDSKSVRINQRALPVLRSEALTVHSAAVHTVSGATYTSEGYARSLQSALDAARAAGALTA